MSDSTNSKTNEQQDGDDVEIWGDKFTVDTDPGGAGDAQEDDDATGDAEAGGEADAEAGGEADAEAGGEADADEDADQSEVSEGEDSSEPAEQDAGPDREIRSEFDYQSETEAGGDGESESGSRAGDGAESPSGTPSRTQKETPTESGAQSQDQSPTESPVQAQGQSPTQRQRQSRAQREPETGASGQVQVTGSEDEEEGDDFAIGEDRELVADHPVKGEVLRDVRAHFQSLETDGRFASAPPLEFVRDRWFDFEYLDDHEVVEWQWANKPYAYVAVVQRRNEEKYRYHVNEVVLSDFEQYVRDDLVKTLRNRLMYQDLEDSSEREAVFERKVEEIISDHAATTVEDGALRKLKYYLMRDFVHHGPIDPLMRDPDIEDISCDGVDVPVYVYHFEHRDLRSNIKFSQQELNSFTLRLAQRAGEQVSVSDPLVDGTLPDGSRLQLTFGSDVSTRGSNFTIRKFANIPFTPVDLVQHGTFTVEQMAYFWLAIESNRSLIFSGGTASGKTTSMNAVSMFIPEDSKVVSIEDTREITLPHENWVPSLTRESITAEGRGEVTMYELLQAALRQRPEYIVVGEIRTDANVAFTFFQAIGTGHTAYTTIHAESIEGVLNRLENEPLSVPTQMILELDVISIQTQTFVDGERMRRNEEVTELLPGGEAQDSVRAINVFERDAEADSIDRTNNSQVLQEIADDRGWDDRRLAEELRERREFLAYLVDNDISSYDEVTTAIHAFGNNRERLMAKVQSGELTTASLERNR